MATNVQSLADRSGVELEELYRMTVNDYEALADSGVLDDPNVELIDGLLVKKMTKKPLHVSVAERLAGTLETMLPPGWYLREQNPLRIPDYDEPEPDLVIARGSRGTYIDRHPGPDDVALVIEVADTSLERDRGKKLAAYGRGGIGCYWNVNLIANQIELYTQPDIEAGGYRDRVICKGASEIPVVVDAGLVGQLRVRVVLP